MIQWSWDCADLPDKALLPHLESKDGTRLIPEHRFPTRKDIEHIMPAAKRRQQYAKNAFSSLSLFAEKNKDRMFKWVVKPLISTTKMLTTESGTSLIARHQQRKAQANSFVLWPMILHLGQLYFMVEPMVLSLMQHGVEWTKIMLLQHFCLVLITATMQLHVCPVCFTLRFSLTFHGKLLYCWVKMFKQTHWSFSWKVGRVNWKCTPKKSSLVSLQIQQQNFINLDS